jgi:hypothetical protein
LLTCSRCFPFGPPRAISLGLRAHRQSGKPTNDLGTLSCL